MPTAIRAIHRLPSLPNAGMILPAPPHDAGAVGAKVVRFIWLRVAKKVPAALQRRLQAISGALQIRVRRFNSDLGLQLNQRVR